MKRKLIKNPIPLQWGAGAVDRLDPEIEERKSSEKILRQQLADVGIPLSRTYDLRESQLMELLGDNVGLEAVIMNNQALVYSARTG